MKLIVDCSLGADPADKAYNEISLNTPFAYPIIVSSEVRSYGTFWTLYPLLGLVPAPTTPSVIAAVLIAVPALPSYFVDVSASTAVPLVAYIKTPLYEASPNPTFISLIVTFVNLPPNGEITPSPNALFCPDPA